MSFDRTLRLLEAADAADAGAGSSTENDALRRPLLSSAAGGGGLQDSSTLSPVVSSVSAPGSPMRAPSPTPLSAKASRFAPVVADAVEPEDLKAAGLVPLAEAARPFDYDEAVRGLGDDERFELAALWVHDALHFRVAYPMVTPAARAAHRLLHRAWFRVFRKVVILAHLLAAVFEFPSEFPLDSGFTQALEAVAVAVYAYELHLHRRIKGHRALARGPWKVGKAALLFVTLADAALSLAAPWWPRYRPLRATRVFYLVENSRDLRAAFSHFGRLVPRLLTTMGLLAVLVFVYAVAGLVLFGRLDVPASRYPGYFHTFGDSVQRLFECLTTVTFPDVMLPSTERSEYYAVYWVSFLVVGLYFLLNLSMAIILFSYKGFLKADFSLKIARQQWSLDAVFSLLSAPAGGADGERYVDERCFLRLFRRAYPRYEDADATPIFRALDTSGDGTLDRREFVELCGILEHSLAMSEAMQIVFEEAVEAEERQNGGGGGGGAGDARGGLRVRLRRVLARPASRAAAQLLLAGNAALLLAEAVMASDGRWPSEFFYADVAVCGAFAAAACVRLAAAGWRRYRLDFWGLYDLAVLAAGAAAFAAWPAAGAVLYRSLMVPRLVSHVAVFRDLFAVVGRLLRPSAVNFASVFVIMYVYAIAGIVLFRDGLTGPGAASRVANTFYEGDQFQELDFSTFARSLLIMFTLLVVNNWQVTASGAIAATGSQWAFLFFASFWIIAVVVVVQVLVAQLLDSFSSGLATRSADEAAAPPPPSDEAASIVEWKIQSQRRARAQIRSEQARQARIRRSLVLQAMPTRPAATGDDLSFLGEDGF